ncbi:hypothetical protein C9J22_18315 [Photobacterium phosphoreum]|uniref:O-antigen polysaccharide polymerase Wzy n=1 Tax=Photobacterium phosphoreum TaxID=659 RepID=UPI000D161933|nr:O-antigen polysaccharide polymerase Wzy [Photobacterium phosphoreum]PSU68071.1 hypothetical protein C9J22_18315 [Photobacterium phosphoreum]
MNNINKPVLLVFILFFSTLFSFIPNVYNVTSLFFANSFIILYVIIGLTLFIYRVNPVSLYFLFYITFGLFIGGRFFYSFIHYWLFFDNGLNLGELFNQYRMTVTDFSYDQIVFTFILIINWLSFSCVGFLLTYKKNTVSIFNISVPEKVSKISFYFFVLLSIYLIIIKIYLLQNIYANGYLFLYKRGDEYTTDNSITLILNILLMFSFSISVLSEKYRKKAIIILLFVGVVEGLTGRRSVFVTKVFAAIFVVGVFNKINLRKLLTYSVVIYLAMTTVYFFSARNVDTNNVGSKNYIEQSLDFIESQGTTLGVIGFSVHEIKDISLRLKLKTFIPMVNNIYTTFFGDISFYERSIGQYISYKANSAAYMNGGGLGSSIVSESYLVFPSIYLSIMFAFLFGYFLNILEYKKNSSLLIFILNVSVCFEVVMLPRTGLTVFFTNILVISIIFCISYPFIKCTKWSVK